ncbi:hypothetical protein [Methanosarcina vacuolata]|uniref:Uncharacterized protein n=1 Tax=Methanosarcina vacuolata Z-761 TaxID=1434123 RepID=A0A0E3LI07_9EURY|nr:hypothetical protein [Methanosarcina vacuolata]AKB45191.1 hypothetical protein MSVAZ_2922 [Methanosarcina vacuolata Z-761]
MTKKDTLTIVSLAVIGSIVAVLLSSDKPTAGLTALAVLIASASLYESAKTSEKNNEQMEKSLKLTEITLEKAEIEQKTRTIKEQLNVFYYPLYDYITRDPSINECWQPSTLNKIGMYRYFANKEIIEQFEVFRNSGYGYGSEPCNKLTESIKIEIKLLESRCRELNNGLNILDNEYNQIKNDSYKGR